MKRVCALIISVLLLIPMAFAQSESYDWGCPMYGRPSIDLSPISNFLEAAKEEEIYIPLEKIGVSHREKDEWINFEVGDSFWMLYDKNYDGSEDVFLLEVPLSYRPKDVVMPIFIASVLLIEKADAEKIFRTLQYNVIDGKSVIEKENIKYRYVENKWFQSITINVYFQEGE